MKCKKCNSELVLVSGIFTGVSNYGKGRYLQFQRCENTDCEFQGLLINLYVRD